MKEKEEAKKRQEEEMKAKNEYFREKRAIETEEKKQEEDKQRQENYASRFRTKVANKPPGDKNNAYNRTRHNTRVNKKGGNGKKIKSKTLKKYKAKN
jgi:hypothetical protein